MKKCCEETDKCTPTSEERFRYKWCDAESIGDHDPEQHQHDNRYRLVSGARSQTAAGEGRGARGAPDQRTTIARVSPAWFEAEEITSVFTTSRKCGMAGF